MSEQQIALRNQLLMMGFEAPDNYTLTQLKKKITELEKSYEAPVVEPVVEAPVVEPVVEAPVVEPVVEAPVVLSMSDAHDIDLTQPDEGTPLKVGEVDFIAVHDFTFRGESYTKGKEYSTTLAFFNNFKLQDLVKHV
jgi:hypothetical protein